MIWPTIRRFFSCTVQNLHPDRLKKVRPFFNLEHLEDRTVPASLGLALKYNALIFGNLLVTNESDLSLIHI